MTEKVNNSAVTRVNVHYLLKGKTSYVWEMQIFEFLRSI